MQWSLTKSQQEQLKFIFDSIQALAVVVGIYMAVHTYQLDTENRNQKAAEDAMAAKTQANIALRDLSRAYRERHLATYFEAARVTSHLATAPDVERTVFEARFFELYYGEMVFVESKEVTDAMIAFCKSVFSPNECDPADKDEARPARDRPKSLAKAVALARIADREIRGEWSPASR